MINQPFSKKEHLNQGDSSHCLRLIASLNAQRVNRLSASVIWKPMISFSIFHVTFNALSSGKLHSGRSLSLTFFSLCSSGIVSHALLLVSFVRLYPLYHIPSLL